MGQCCWSTAGVWHAAVVPARPALLRPSRETYCTYCVERLFTISPRSLPNDREASHAPLRATATITRTCTTTGGRWIFCAKCSAKALLKRGLARSLSDSAVRSENQTDAPGRLTGQVAHSERAFNPLSYVAPFPACGTGRSGSGYRTPGRYPGLVCAAPLGLSSAGKTHENRCHE